jgi:cytochrome c5
MRRFGTSCIAAWLLFSLTECGETPTQEGTAQKVARADAMTPNEPRLSEIYARTCRACHVSPDSGAPLTGDKAAWRPRLAAGRPAVEANMRNGLRAMPPRGQCLDCNDASLWALTIFMAQEESPP